MDWVTLTKHEIEEDALPEICMVSGTPATTRINKTFTWVPEWVGYLYWLGVLPGLVATAIFKREMRVSCPVCAKHKDHWRAQEQMKLFGWLLLAGIGAGVGAVLGSIQWSRDLTPTSGIRMAIGAGVGLGIGLTIWLLLLLWYRQSRIRVAKITDSELHLVGVAQAFVMAVKERRREGPIIPSMGTSEQAKQG